VGSTGGLPPEASAIVVSVVMGGSSSEVSAIVKLDRVAMLMDGD
jgi:hypothetical protein